jgi:glycosyltransferase involved in cell wall biosynthesis
MNNEEKSKLIENGYETCKKYNWDDAANKYYEVYKSMLPSEQ